MYRRNICNCRQVYRPSSEMSIIDQDMEDCNIRTTETNDCCLKLARAYIKNQQFDKYFCPMESLSSGTAFPELHDSYTGRWM